MTDGSTESAVEALLFLTAVSVVYIRCCSTLRDTYSGASDTQYITND